MAHMNVHATRGLENFKSKKAFRDAVLADITDPAAPAVRFRTTSPMGPQGINTLGDLLTRPEVTLVVVGPCPNTDRRWYASVAVVTVKGEVKIKVS